MSKKRPPDQPPFDWAEFVEARRLDELRRQHCRPSQMLHHHSQTWRDPYRPEVPTWLGIGPQTAAQRAAADSARASLFARMVGLNLKR